MLPNFLVVGAMKGGSSALTRGIAQHRDVFIAAGKEMHYFDRHFERGISWYESCFAGAEGKLAIGESTPTYMNDPMVRSRMLEVLPSARFVAIIRHPADRAYSHYWHNRRRGREQRSFAEAITEQAPAELFAYLDLSRYAERLQGLEKNAGAERLLVLLNEDLRHHRADTLRKVWGFLGVDPDFGVTIEPRPRRGLMGRVRQRRRPPSEYPPMAASTRTNLVEHFAEEIDRLEQWLGRDLSAWRA